MSKRIVITGNIGSGKSFVTKIFEEQGFKSISADEINENVLIKNKDIICKTFDIKFNDLKSFKKDLGNKIFTNDEYRKKLEDILIPKIMKEIEVKSSAFEKKDIAFVIELPTFFETRGLKHHDGFFVINIVSNEETRFKRIQLRNPHLTNQQIKDRMNSQINPYLKSKYSDLTIENTSSVEALKQKVLEVICHHLN